MDEFKLKKDMAFFFYEKDMTFSSLFLYTHKFLNPINDFRRFKFNNFLDDFETENLL